MRRTIRSLNRRWHLLIGTKTNRLQGVELPTDAVAVPAFIRNVIFSGL